MYIPKKYQEEGWEQVEYLINKYPLATIITTTDDNEIIANHVPLYLKVEASGERKLIAHIAKANHQIPSLTSNNNVLVIFNQQTHTLHLTIIPPKLILIKLSLHGTSQVLTFTGRPKSLTISNLSEINLIT